eukprot:gene1118-3950_t
MSAEPTDAEILAARAQMRSAGSESDPMTTDNESDEENDSSDEDIDEAKDAVTQAKDMAASMASQKSTSGAGRDARGADKLEVAMRDLDMDNYDNEDSGAMSLMSRVLGGRSNIAKDEDGDQFINLDDNGSESDAEEGDFEIKPTDLVILAARNEDDVSNLEVWVYEEAEMAGEEANIFVHHDVMLPSFPLALAWMDCDPSGTRDRCNMLAVSTLEPGIEIWDLDMVDSVEPAAVLGGEDKAATSAAIDVAAQAEVNKEAAKNKKKAEVNKEAAKNKKKKKKAVALPKRVVVPGSHSDAVLGLSWNREYRNVLASGSADCTVKVWDVLKQVWDVSQQVCEHTLTHHKGKVQAVAWNPVESPVLLTGSFDKTACLVDVRTPTGDPVSWKVSADVEALIWHPHEPTCFLVSSEDGLVACFDARKGAAPGLLATASTDKKVKLWDVSTGAPSMVASQDLSLGAVFSLAFCPEAPCLLAVGGAQGGVTVWDVRTNAGVMSKWPQLKRNGMGN